jgi:hypothetical protein
MGSWKMDIVYFLQANTLNPDRFAIFKFNQSCRIYIAIDVATRKIGSRLPRPHRHLVASSQHRVLIVA